MAELSEISRLTSERSGRSRSLVHPDLDRRSP